MSLFEGGQFVAGENIRPGVVVALDRNNDFRVITARTSLLGTGNTNIPDKQHALLIVGVAPTWSRRPNDFANADFAAVTGELLPVYRNGQIALVRVHTNVGVTRGDPLIVAEHHDPTNINAGCVRPLSWNDGAPNFRRYVIIGYALHSAPAGGANVHNYVRVLLDIKMVENKET